MGPEAGGSSSHYKPNFPQSNLLGPHRVLLENRILPVFTGQISYNRVTTRFGRPS